MLNSVILTATVQVLGDLAGCFFSLACAFSKDQRFRTFFILNAIAFIALALGDIYYNYLFRILQRDISTSNDVIVTGSILIFQLAQVYNWYKLIRMQKVAVFSYDHLAYLLFTVIVIGIVIYYFLIGSKLSPDLPSSLNQSLNAICNMSAWFFAIICLARARSKSVILLSLGCLLIVTSALTTDCLFMFEMDKVATASSIHMFWILGILAMAAGSYFCLSDKEFQFCPPDSIQARCCSWLSITSLVIVLIGFAFMSFFNLEFNLHVESILWSIPIVLVFTMLFSVLFGNWLSNMILRPISHFLQRIEAFNLGQPIKEEHLYATSLYEFKVLGDFINSSFKKLSTQLEREIEIAAQVAHDIRSPLTALEVVIKRLPEIDESKRILLRDAVSHIRDITNSLEKSSPSDSRYEQRSIINIAILLDYVVSERRVAFMSQPVEINYEYDFDCYQLFIDVVPSDMKTVLTNIINNACEAILPENGKVNVSLVRKEDSVVITVCDNGPGITQEILGSLFTRGVTTKNKGSGLGLYSARESLSRWNGSVELIPNVERGISAYIKLPLQNPPSWFISSLSFPNKSTVVCVDDSISIYHAWQERFNSVDGNIDLRYCSSKEDLLKELETLNQKACTYFVDYEFSGSSYTGMELVDIILSLGTPNNRIFLVTSRSNETEVQELCKNRGIYMISKIFALKMDLRIIKTPPENIVIIPSSDYHEFQTKYPSSTKKTWVYQELSDFFADITLFDKSSKVFVNINLFNSSLEEILKTYNFTIHIFQSLDNLNNLISVDGANHKFLMGEPYGR